MTSPPQVRIDLEIDQYDLADRKSTALVYDASVSQVCHINSTETIIPFYYKHSKQPCSSQPLQPSSTNHVVILNPQQQAKETNYPLPLLIDCRQALGPPN